MAKKTSERNASILSCLAAVDVALAIGNTLNSKKDNRFTLLRIIICKMNISGRYLIFYHEHGKHIFTFASVKVAADSQTGSNI